uniref:Uncharacterized protein n=1 Tax=Anguilla anguilla TaxID=7936 RepID=A0A0E9V890_ANGAN
MVGLKTYRMTDLKEQGWTALVRGGRSRGQKVKVPSCP